MVPEQELRVITSKFDATCRVCGRMHIKAGDVIMWKPGYVASKKCYDHRRVARTTLAYLEEKMLGKGIALFSRAFENRDIEICYTRRAFLLRAKEEGLLNSKDEKLLLWYWAGVLDNDLTD